MENWSVLFLLLYFLSITKIYEGIKHHNPTRAYFTIDSSQNSKVLSTTRNSPHLKNWNKLMKPDEKKKGDKFLHFENTKQISINPLFPALCKSVSVSETCLHNIHNFFSDVNRNSENDEKGKQKQFCGVLYGTHDKEKKTVKIENVFFCMNSSETCYNKEYLLDSEERKKADKLAKFLNLEVVGFIYAHADIGIDEIDKPDVSEKEIRNVKQKKKNKKVNTLNDEDNEFFIPMGGKEVLLALLLMKQIEEPSEKRDGKECPQLSPMINGFRTTSTDAIAADDSMSKEAKKKKNKKKKMMKLDIKPFITLSVGMNQSNGSIVVEAYEMNYDLVKLLNFNRIKDIEKQNSILQFAKKSNEKEKKIKRLDSEIDIMNELYLKCKKNVLIKDVEIKKIDIIFCVNNVPIFSHKSSFNSFFPYPLNNYYKIFEKFNHMIRSTEKAKDIVPIFRDFNFLLFLTNFFSVDHDIPHFCKAVNDLTNSISIPEHYISILKSLSSSAHIL